MKPITQRSQQTIARPVTVEGTGYLTGKRVRLRLIPAPASAGVFFVRIDLGPDARIPADIAHVTGTQRRTTLGHPPVNVGLVEHVLGALKGMHVDNCVIEVDAPEPPGMDGSAADFVKALRRAGLTLQTQPRTVWGVEEPVVVQQHGATLTLHPGPPGELRVSYLLDYGPRSPIDRQIYTEVITPESFLQEIAPCRTFLLEEEAQLLRQQGIGRNSRVTDLLIFGPHGPCQTKLRFGNEPARHKVLDMLGDLSLLGLELCGHLVGYRSGHPLNVELVRVLRAQLPQTVAPRRRRAA